MTNPYAAPTTETSHDSAVAPAGEPAVWFTPGQIGWSSAFATPLVGGLLVAANSRAAGQHRRAGWDIAIGVGLLGLAIAVSFIPRLPGVVSVVWALAMYNSGKLRWAERLEGHPKPLPRSSWHAIAYVLVTLLFLGISVVGVFLATDQFDPGIPD